MKHRRIIFEKLAICWTYLTLDVGVILANETIEPSNLLIVK